MDRVGSCLPHFVLFDFRLDDMAALGDCCFSLSGPACTCSRLIVAYPRSFLLPVWPAIALLFVTVLFVCWLIKFLTDCSRSMRCDSDVDPRFLGYRVRVAITFNEKQEQRSTISPQFSVSSGPLSQDQAIWCNCPK